MKNNYPELMGAKPLVKISDKKYQFERGQLFGYLLNGNIISACYPVWHQKEDEVQFVLYGLDKGRPTIDNTWIRENDSFPIYTNVEPIIIDIDSLIKKPPTTFQNEVGSIFNP